MKIYKLDSKALEQKQFKANNINELSEGVTMRLLEKYKPKGHEKIKTMNRKKDSKSVA